MFLEALPVGSSYPVTFSDGGSAVNDMPDITATSDELFALGDNRDRSLDGRSIADSIPIRFEHLVANAAVIYWAKDKSRLSTHAR